MAGYSKRPLVEKLGIKPGYKLFLVNPPENYAETLGALPPNVIILSRLDNPCEFIQFFTTDRTELERRFPELMKGLTRNGMLWVSWPKGSSKVKTDLNENVVREIGLSNKLVDIKVCAVDDIWSGLKFVYRREDRK